MDFLFYLLLWCTLGGILVYLINKLVSTNPKRKIKRTSKNKTLKNYGGPEFELPPGIVLQEEDDDEMSSQNLKAKS